MTYEEALLYFREELRLCSLAPSVNGCPMTEDWQRTIEACQIAIAAIRSMSALDMARSERYAMACRMAELEKELSQYQETSV